MSNSPTAVLDWPIGAEAEHESEDDGWVDVIPVAQQTASEDDVEDFLAWIEPLAQQIETAGRPAWAMNDPC